MAGSDVSYESVASEGGWIAASERGRDPIPRIISSSHCVDAYLRLGNKDGPWCSRGEAIAGWLSQGAHHQYEALTDPLMSLPLKMLRFDGAMEAWLKEIPPHRGGIGNSVMPFGPPTKNRPYMSLEDAANRQDLKLNVLRSGNRRATIWYFTREFLEQLWPLYLHPDSVGLTMWEKALVERRCTIQSTHVQLGHVHAPSSSKKPRQEWLIELFGKLQVERWSPNGEARKMLEQRRLSHASMSIGDAVSVGDHLYIAGLARFIEIPEEHAAIMLPQERDVQFGGESDKEDDDDDEDTDEFYSDEDSESDEDSDSEEDAGIASLAKGKADPAVIASLAKGKADPAVKGGKPEVVPQDGHAKGCGKGGWKKAGKAGDRDAEAQGVHKGKRGKGKQKGKKGGKESADSDGTGYADMAMHEVEDSWGGKGKRGKGGKTGKKGGKDYADAAAGGKGFGEPDMAMQEFEESWVGKSKRGKGWKNNRKKGGKDYADAAAGGKGFGAPDMAKQEFEDSGAGKGKRGKGGKNNGKKGGKDHADAAAGSKGFGAPDMAMQEFEESWGGKSKHGKGGRNWGKKADSNDWQDGEATSEPKGGKRGNKWRKKRNN